MTNNYERDHQKKEERNKAPWVKNGCEPLF